MRHFIINIIKYLGYFCLFYIVFCSCLALTTIKTPRLESALMTCAGNYGRNFVRTKDLDKWIDKKTDDPKGVIIGSSTAYRNINPFILTEETNINFFNLGSSSQSLLHSAPILDYVTKNTDVDYVLLDCYPGTWNNNKVEAATDWVVNNYKPQRKYVLDMVLKVNNMKLWLYYTYFCIKRTIPFTNDFLFCAPDNGNYVGKGFVYTPDEVNRSPIKHERYNFISEENDDALQKIIKLCKERDIQLVLLMPKVFDAEIDYALLTGYNIPLIYGDRFDVDTTYYYDSHHMYGKGTDSFSKWVAKEVTKTLE